MFFSNHGGGYNAKKGELSGGRIDFPPLDEGNETWNATIGEWVGIDSNYETAQKTMKMSDTKNSLSDKTSKIRLHGSVTKRKNFIGNQI
jgi:hypothetical protein